MEKTIFSLKNNLCLIHFIHSVETDDNIRWYCTNIHLLSSRSVPGSHGSWLEHSLLSELSLVGGDRFVPETKSSAPQLSVGVHTFGENESIINQDARISKGVSDTHIVGRLGPKPQIS